MLSSAGECGVGGEELVAVAGELAFEAAHGFAFAFAAREQAVVVGACLGVAAEAGAGDHVQGGVELAVAAAAAAVAAAGAAAGLAGAGAGGPGGGRLVSHPAALAPADRPRGGAAAPDAALGETLGA